MAVGGERVRSSGELGRGGLAASVRDLDPFPTFFRDGFGYSLKLLAAQTIKQGRVFQPAAVIALEEVMQHGTASSLISLDADKDSTTVRGAHRGFGRHASDLIRLFIRNSQAPLAR